MIDQSADTITNDKKSNPINRFKDYHWLRAKGIAYIQELCGKSWTDHNAHDPGITILEQFCYALTDLAYRADFPIADLMSESGRAHWGEVYQARQMLTINPVNLSDWRKLFLDIEGIKNVWIDKKVDSSNIKGLYQIEYVPDEHHQAADIQQEIYQKFHVHRNLCEDLALSDIRKLEEVDIELKGVVNISEVSDLQNVLRKIYSKIQQYISPNIPFHSLQEMLARGLPIEEIMSGPKLVNGYILDEDLSSFVIRRKITISDLIHLIMDTPGVDEVQELELKGNGNTAKISSNPADSWVIELAEGQVGRLKLNMTPGPWMIRLQQNGQVYEEALEPVAAPEQKKPTPGGLDFIFPPGRDREIHKYQSMIYQFPEIYGIGKSGLPLNSSPRRRAQAKQLKAYLSIFDQLLTNSFAQLAGVKQLFDLESGKDNPTVFKQSLLEEIPALGQLINKETYNELLTVSQEVPSRHNRLIHHLLARFGEYFADFNLASFRDGNRDKPRQFLKEYPKHSYERFRGVGYLNSDKSGQKLSAFEKRIAYQLDLSLERPTSVADLSNEDKGAFYLVEHILLRPNTAGSASKSTLSSLLISGVAGNDPYSLQMSFVFPDWLKKFEENNPYWEFVVKTLRMQTPAHIRIYIRRLNQAEMRTFESAYKAL